MAKKAGKASYGMHMSPATKPGKITGPGYDLMKVNPVKVKRTKRPAYPGGHVRYGGKQ